MDNLTRPAASPHLAFAQIDRFSEITGLSRRVIYDEIGRGNLRAVKRGASTLIDVQHGLGWLRSLPPARVRAPGQKVTAEQHVDQ